MRDHDISQRRACRLVGVDPKTVRRERPPDNPEIRKEMKAVAAKLKALEDENAKLKRLLADQMLDNVVLKDLLGKS